MKKKGGKGPSVLGWKPDPVTYLLSDLGMAGHTVSAVVVTDPVPPPPSQPMWGNAYTSSEPGTRPSQSERPRTVGMVIGSKLNT